MIENKQPPTCVLIDDDDDDRDFLLDALSRIDGTYKCVHVKDGAEGLKLLSSGDIVPDFILLDLNMPKMSGPECLTQLRKLPHLRATPVYIYTTAQCSVGMITNMISIGAESVLMKPVRMNDLIKLIQKIVDQVNIRKVRQSMSQLR